MFATYGDKTANVNVNIININIKLNDCHPAEHHLPFFLVKGTCMFISFEWESVNHFFIIIQNSQCCLYICSSVNL